jgi:hypothetical protein
MMDEKIGGILNMTLKEEFMDMMNLIAPNINNESYEEDYTIEQDFFMDVCNISGNDVTYYGCEKCEHCSEQRIECVYKKRKKVDMYLWSGSEECKGYIFNAKLENPIWKNAIKCINNRKDLLSEMHILKDQFEWYKNRYAEYAKRLEEYKRYITEFIDEITADFSIFSIIDKDIIPVVFCSDFRKDHDWNKKTFTAGDNHTYGIQSVIHIYNSWNDNTDDIKRTIRHELIHYLLWCVNPFGVWQKDNSCVFHYFCNVYDANAYEEMDKDNKELYEMMVKSSKQDIDEFLQKTLEQMKKE